LLNLAEELGNVAKACKRNTFYRHQGLVEEDGVDNLINKSRRAPNPKNWVDEATECTVVEYALEQRAYGQHRTNGGDRNFHRLQNFPHIKNTPHTANHAVIARGGIFQRDL